MRYVEMLDRLVDILEENNKEVNNNKEFNYLYDILMGVLLEKDREEDN